MTKKWYWIVCLTYGIIIILDYITEYSLYILGKNKSFELDEVSFFVLPTPLIGILIAPLTFKIYQRYKHKEFKKVWKYHLLASLAIALLFGFLSRTYWMIQSYIFEPLEVQASFIEVLRKYYKFLLPVSLSGIIHYWAITILLFALDFYDQFRDQSYRSIQLEAQLNESKLQNLRMQLNPHFLFNALNTVSMMVRKDKKSNAINMISGVSDLLRSSLNSSNALFISLREEIELLKKYLYVEEQRFRDRLTVEYDIADDIWDFKIPNLLLQPLVENAFKYGVSNNINTAYIKISAQKEGGNIHLSIYNKGNLLDQSVQEGIGLKNTQSRLEMSYDTYSFTLKNDKDLSGVVATIIIPMPHD